MEATLKPVVPPRQPRQRVTRRMVERQRRRRRKLMMAGLALTVLILGGAGVIMIAPLLGGNGGGGGGGGGNGGDPTIISRDPMHIHANLSIWRGTQKATIPEDIGRAPSSHYADHGLDKYLDIREGTVGQLSPLHTHATDGIIHIEAAVTRHFTLGEFFSVWGQPLGPQQTVDLIPDATHALTMTVNGIANNEWGSHIFSPWDDIEIHYDTV